MVLEQTTEDDTLSDTGDSVTTTTATKNKN